MSLSWIARFRGSPWVVVVPLASVLLLFYFSVYAFDQGSRMSETASTPQLIGTLLMFSLLPTYFAGMLIVLWFQTSSVLDQLEPYAQARDAARSRRRLNHLHPLGLLLVLLGVVYGAWQNHFLLEHLRATGSFNRLDIAVSFGNCFVWAMVGLIFAWTLPLSASLSRLGRGMRVDLYRLDRVRPLGRLATYSVLTVAGSMALMPLQSLDAEFRWENYEAGITVGVPAAIGLFLLPLVGVRNNIRERKRERLEVLNARIDEVARDDVVQLETIAAHVERNSQSPQLAAGPGQHDAPARVCGHSAAGLDRGSPGRKPRRSFRYVAASCSRILGCFCNQMVAR